MNTKVSLRPNSTASLMDDSSINFRNVKIIKMAKIWPKMKKNLVQKLTDELSHNNGSINEAGEFGISVLDIFQY